MPSILSALQRNTCDSHPIILMFFSILELPNQPVRSWPSWKMMPHFLRTLSTVRVSLSPLLWLQCTSPSHMCICIYSCTYFHVYQLDEIHRGLRATADGSGEDPLTRLKRARMGRESALLVLWNVCLMTHWLQRGATPVRPGSCTTLHMLLDFSMYLIYL